MPELLVNNHTFPIDRLKPYILGEIAQAVLKARLDGRDIIDLSQANPDLTPPSSIIDSLVQEIIRPNNHRYTATSGIRKYRESVAKYYSIKHGVELDVDTEVVSTMGSKEGISNFLHGVVSNGDMAVSPYPVYPIHFSSAFLAGCNCISLQIQDILEETMGSDDENDHYMLTSNSNKFFERLERIFRNNYPSPKFFIFAFPHNPTSCTVSYCFYERLVEYAKRFGMILVSDFAYSNLSYDGYKPPSLLEVPGAIDCSIEFLSLSKGFGLAGWRVGAAVGNKKLIAALKKIKSYVDFGVFQPIQIAVAKLLDDGGSDCQQIVDSYEQRRNVLCGGLKELGWKFHTPKAGVFIWSKIPFENMRSLEFSKLVLDKSDVAICPGVGFSWAADSYVRFCLMESQMRLTKGISKLSQI